MDENITSAPPVAVKKNTPRDLFLHLLAMVTLYWSAITFTTLLWQCINSFFPDALNAFSSSSYYSSLIRFSVSTLIIVFPVFILVSWYLNKIYRRETAVRDSKLRKWLIYITLFVASLVIIGDLITIINTFLGGEVQARFILKALSILLTAGMVFGYYLDDVRREAPAKSAKYFAWISGTLVLIAIILAFFVIGSPNTARLLQFDQQKVSDLQNIQSQVVNYYQRKGAMPNSLADLNDTISGYVAPTDPQTKASYDYYLTNAATLSFELCANFNQPSQNSPSYAYPAGAGISQNWNHQSSRVCFARTIDRQLYPLFNTAK